MTKDYLALLEQENNFTLGNAMLEQLIDNSILNLDPRYIMPASFDLPLERGWEMKGAIQRQHGETVWDVIKNFKKRDIKHGAVLEVGKTYMFKVLPRLNLPQGVHGFANPKSTTGRLGIVAHLKTDETQRNDVVVSGHYGDLWVEVTPESFPILWRQGDAVNQVRLFKGEWMLDDLTLMKLYAQEPFMYTPYGKEIAPRRQLFNKGILQTLNLDLEIPGFVAKENTKKLDPVELGNSSQQLPWEDYWNVLAVENRVATLPRNRLVIALTYELNRIPTSLAGNMLKIDETIGGKSVHDAGFFDPGFGRVDDQPGSAGVLEIRAYNSNILVRHRELITGISFGRVLGCSEQYGDKSNYQGQGYHLDARKILPKLAKQFRMEGL